MSLILIKEDGTGLANANAYANAADCDAYHDAHLYPLSWQAATPDNKDKALVFATRVIDAQYRFYGFRTTTTQALQWPRTNCPDPDSTPDSSGSASLASNQIPKALINATCEMARALLVSDRTAAPPGEGIDTFSVTGSLTRYSKIDTRPVISQAAQAFLSKLGDLKGQGTSASVPLIRV